MYNSIRIYIFIEILASSVKPVLRAIVFLTLSRPRAPQIRGRVRPDHHRRGLFLFFSPLRQSDHYNIIGEITSLFPYDAQ